MFCSMLLSENMRAVFEIVLQKLCIYFISDTDASIEKSFTGERIFFECSHLRNSCQNDHLTQNILSTANILYSHVWSCTIFQAETQDFSVFLQ